MSEQPPAGPPDKGRRNTGVTGLRDRLRDAIVAGEIPANAGRTQAQLAEFFDVSRTPLREALRMLELEHLIIREPNGRFRAADLSADEIEQLAVTAITLESAAVRLTVPDLTIADDARLEGLLAESLRLAEVGEWNAYEVPHRAFHMLLARNVGTMHTEQLNRGWDQSIRYRQAFGRVANAAGRDSAPQREHREILDAALARDADATARLVALHHRRGMGEIATSLNPDYETSTLDKTIEIITEDHHPQLA
ncbi:MAG: GntR family transcriptional regulator [Actinobacteria bacterium]|nr:GntR family transcriptional regulator [Actinomycetota bacterium]